MKTYIKYNVKYQQRRHYLKSNHKSQAQPVQRINNAIKASEVLVILPNGETVGPIRIEEALQIAKDMSLDLAEVAPNANPPVCKVLDYGKFKYEQNKKQKNTYKKKPTLKEIRMQPKISEHDLNFKIKHIVQFLSEGNKVKVTIRFKGRELAHTEIGRDILLSIIETITCSFNIDKEPVLEGRNMSMLLSPSSKKGVAKKISQLSTPPPADTSSSMQTEHTPIPEPTSEPIPHDNI